MTEVTRILAAIEQGDAHLAEQLLPLVYTELRRLAAQRLSREAPGQTLEPTGLVHEAYLRLVDVEETAEMLGVSPRKGYRIWAYARAWLLRALGRDEAAEK